MQVPTMGRYLTNSSRFFATYPFIVPLVLAPVTFSNAATLFTNMPAARTEWPVTVIGSCPKRFQWDLTYRQRIAIALTQINVLGSAGSKITIEYSTDNGTSWNQFTNEQLLAIDSAGDPTKCVEWVLTDAERTDVLLRIVGEGGNGVADPNISTLAQFTGQLPVVSAQRLYSGEYIFFMPGTNKLYSATQRVSFDASNPVWTNMPAAETQFPVAIQPAKTLTNLPGLKLRRVRFNCTVVVAGSANAEWSVKYSTNGGVTYKNFDSETTNTGCWVSIATTGLKISSFINVDKDCANTTSVLFAMWGRNGNGVADPSPSGATPSSNTGLPTIEFETYERSEG